MKFQFFSNLFVSFFSLLFLMTSSVLGAEDLTQSVFEECGLFPGVEVRQRCYRENLSAIMRKEGTVTALQVLEHLARLDLHIRRNAHPYAHHLGRKSFDYYQNAEKAFHQCGPSFWSGCFHGVLESYVLSWREASATKINRVCTEEIRALKSAFTQYQCLHGLGHGLTVRFGYDLSRALTSCDALASEWERQSCHSGVFMENVVAFLEPGHSHRDHRDGLDGPVRNLLRPEDPHYPCNAIADAYGPACYRMQSSAILVFSNYDFALAFGVCGEAPSAFEAFCFESLGRDISNLSMRNMSKIKNLCQLAPVRYRNLCLSGAVKDLILNQADPLVGFAFCAKVEEGAKETCYAATGEVLLSLFPDRTRRVDLCQGADTSYRRACLEASSVF